MKTKDLQVGRYYVIDFDDHFTAAKTPADNPSLLSPIPMRAMGKLTDITPKLYILEFGRRLDDISPSYERSHWGVLKSSVIAVHDLGTGSHDRKKRS